MLFTLLGLAVRALSSEAKSKPLASDALSLDQKTQMELEKQKQHYAALSKTDVELANVVTDLQLSYAQLEKTYRESWDQIASVQSLLSIEEKLANALSSANNWKDKLQDQEVLPSIDYVICQLTPFLQQVRESLEERQIHFNITPKKISDFGTLYFTVHHADNLQKLPMLKLKQYTEAANSFNMRGFDQSASRSLFTMLCNEWKSRVQLAQVPLQANIEQHKSGSVLMIADSISDITVSFQDDYQSVYRKMVKTTKSLEHQLASSTEQSVKNNLLATPVEKKCALVAKLTQNYQELRAPYLETFIAFQKIYNALYAGQTSFFKSSPTRPPAPQLPLYDKWLQCDPRLPAPIQAACHLYENARTDYTLSVSQLTKIQDYIKQHPDSRTAQALKLAKQYSNACSKDNEQLVRDIHKIAYQKSGLFKRSKTLDMQHVAENSRTWRIMQALK